MDFFRMYVPKHCLEVTHKHESKFTNVTLSALEICIYLHCDTKKMCILESVITRSNFYTPHYFAIS